MLGLCFYARSFTRGGEAAVITLAKAHFLWQYSSSAKLSRRYPTIPVLVFCGVITRLPLCPEIIPDEETKGCVEIGGEEPGF